MWTWTNRPGAFRPAVALACLSAMALGSCGGSRLDAREPVAQGASRDASVASAAKTAIPTPDTSPIVVHATGDVNLDPSELRLVVGSGYDAPWKGVRDLFRSDDVTIVNLECAAGEGGTKVPDKQFNFRCPRGFEAMRDNGVEVANQGNNHSLDYTAVAAMDGRNRLLHARVAPVGIGHNSAEAHEPAIFKRHGRTIAVLGFGGVIPFRDWLATPTHAGMADGDDIPSMVAAVRAAKARADIVLVAIHWGVELDTKPRPDDVVRAHAMIDAGADAIFGHHAHRLQPMEVYKGRPIFYGLGNFVWPQPGPTAIAEVTIPRSGPITGCMLPGRISGMRPALVDPSKGCA